MASRILVDANVLYSRTLRDWLLMLQIETGGTMFTTCWTVDILAETIANVRKNNPHMHGGAMTALHDHIIGSMTEQIVQYGPADDDPIADIYDRHVHAAAIAGQVDILMTADTGFLTLPQDVTDVLPYEICTADSVFTLIADGNPAAVRAVAGAQWEYWRKKNPSSDIPARLAASGCPDFALRVSEHIARLRA